jgi:hypothetical protein
MPPAGFEPEIPASERPQAHSLDRAATGISLSEYTAIIYLNDVNRLIFVVVRDCVVCEVGTEF